MNGFLHIYTVKNYIKYLYIITLHAITFHVNLFLKNLMFFFSSLIDLNRAGTGLMELVFEPDLCNGLEASALVRELLLIFERIKTCSGRMEGRYY